MLCNLSTYETDNQNSSFLPFVSCVTSLSFLIDRPAVGDNDFSILWFGCTRPTVIYTKFSQPINEHYEGHVHASPAGYCLLSFNISHPAVNTSTNSIELRTLLL